MSMLPLMDGLIIVISVAIAGAVGFVLGRCSG